jgi:hypothetical protein
MRKKRFSCPRGCGATIIVFDPKMDSFQCPGCGKVFKMDQLKPYKITKSKKHGKKSTLQHELIFKGRNEGGRQYLEQHERKKEQDHNDMVHHRRRR